MSYLAVIQIGLVQAQTGNLPAIKKNGAATQMYVDGKPFIMLAAELHNSSASSIEYMKPIWKKLQALNLNTVIGTVSWELLEPEEGKFDFTLVDAQIREARARNMRLVLIWFGTWKNAKATYAPLWVKTNTKRFPRVGTKPRPDLKSRFSSFFESSIAPDLSARRGDAGGRHEGVPRVDAAHQRDGPAARGDHDAGGERSGAAGAQPGQYPSGGPVARMMDVWRAAAPANDLLAPDIYVRDFKSTCALYARSGNPLFIPEARAMVGPLFWSLGRHAAMGFSPFGIEDASEDSQLAEAYKALGTMLPVVAKAQAEEKILGVWMEGDGPETATLAGYQLKISTSRMRIPLDAGQTPA